MDKRTTHLIHAPPQECFTASEYNDPSFTLDKNFGVAHYLSASLRTLTNCLQNLIQLLLPLEGSCAVGRCCEQRSLRPSIRQHPRRVSLWIRVVLLERYFSHTLDALEVLFYTVMTTPLSVYSGTTTKSSHEKMLSRECRKFSLVSLITEGKMC